MFLMLSFAACAPSEVDDIFDESPAVRLDNALKSYTEFFQKDGGKWLMQYFASGDEEGHCFVMTFKNDGSVKISGKNPYYNTWNTLKKQAITCSPQQNPLRGSKDAILCLCSAGGTGIL